MFDWRYDLEDSLAFRTPRIATYIDSITHMHERRSFAGVRNMVRDTPHARVEGRASEGQLNTFDLRVFARAKNCTERKDPVYA